jgi:hypothetical protein
MQMKIRVLFGSLSLALLTALSCSISFAEASDDGSYKPASDDVVLHYVGAALSDFDLIRKLDVVPVDHAYQIAIDKPAATLVAELSLAQPRESMADGSNADADRPPTYDARQHAEHRLHSSFQVAGWISYAAPRRYLLAC